MKKKRTLPPFIRPRDTVPAEIWRHLARIEACDEALEPASRDVRFCGMWPGEERVLGPYLFPEVFLFVTQIGETMRSAPGLFPSAQVSGELLLARQAEADAYNYLVRRLQVLLRRARQSYLRAQGEVARDALGVLAQLGHEAHLPSPLTRIERAMRAVLLVPALLTWGRWQARKRRAALRKRAAGAVAPARRGPRTTAVEAARARAEYDAWLKAYLKATAARIAAPLPDPPPAAPALAPSPPAKPPLKDPHHRAWQQVNQRRRRPRL